MVLWKEIEDEDRGKSEKIWVFDESFSICHLDNATFTETFELDEFPFDIQKLKIMVSIRNL